MGATSRTLSYTSIISSVLDKVRKNVEDEISTSNKLLWFYRKSGNWKSVASGGNQYQVELMYGLASADSYNSFGQIDVTPTDGITAAHFSWRQAAAAISISGLEEFQNRGTERIFDLLKARTKQAVLGLEDMFGRALLQGQASIDSTSLTTARTSAVNGSAFVDPLPLLVEYSPSTSVGGISPSTEAWWANQSTDDTSSTYATFLTAMRKMYNDCSKGVGGSKGMPNLVLMDQATYELYESALAAAHRNPSYQKGDIPFENLAFKGSTAMWDEFVADVKNSDLTPAGSDAGTAYFLNTNYMGISFDKQHNFSVGDFVRPENQDEKTALVLWYGTHWISNRRKCGVLAGITTTTAS